MTFKGVVLWIGLAAMTAMAWRQWGWAGLALLSGVVVFWLLLHFNRLMLVVRRASKRPIGSVDSAVMFHSRLQAGRPVLQVVALARSLGEQLPDDDASAQRYRWSDGSGSSVICTFSKGKLAQWELSRPPHET